MSLNPTSYSKAATARVRLGWRRFVHSSDTPLPIALTSALAGAGIAVLK